MKKNEYNAIEEFISEYQGVRDPVNNKWLGLEFKYDNRYFRLSTDSPHELKGCDKVFCLYKFLVTGPCYFLDNDGCELLGEFENIESLLDSLVIDEIKFREIIMDDNTEILAKD